MPSFSGKKIQNDPITTKGAIVIQINLGFLGNPDRIF